MFSNIQIGHRNQSLKLISFLISFWTTILWAMENVIFLWQKIHWVFLIWITECCFAILLPYAVQSDKNTALCYYNNLHEHLTVTHLRSHADEISVDQSENAQEIKLLLEHHHFLHRHWYHARNTYWHTSSRKHIFSRIIVISVDHLCSDCKTEQWDVYPIVFLQALEFDWWII